MGLVPQHGDDLRRLGAGHGADALDAGEVLAPGIGAGAAGIVPSVAFLAAPVGPGVFRVRPAGRIGRVLAVGRVGRARLGRRPILDDQEPVVVQATAADDGRHHAFRRQGLNVGEDVRQHLCAEHAQGRHGLVRMTVEHLVQRLPGVGPGDPAQRLHGGDLQAVVAMAVGADGGVVGIAFGLLAPGLSRRPVDDRVHVHLPLADEIGQVAEVGIVHQFTVPVGLVLEYGNDLFGTGAGHGADALDAGEVLATGIGAVHAQIIPSVAFRAAPVGLGVLGVGPIRRVGGMRRCRRRLPEFQVPVVVQAAAADDGRKILFGGGPGRHRQPAHGEDHGQCG